MITNDFDEVEVFLNRMQPEIEKHAVAFKEILDKYDVRNMSTKKFLKLMKEKVNEMM